MMTTVAEYERKLITERVNAGIHVAQAAGTRFGRPPLDPAGVAEKLRIVDNARKEGRSTADVASLVGWSRPTYYRHRAAQSDTALAGSQPLAAPSVSV